MCFGWIPLRDTGMVLCRGGLYLSVGMDRIGGAMFRTSGMERIWGDLFAGHNWEPMRYVIY